MRCSRCKEVWLARPEDAVEFAPQTPMMAGAGARKAKVRTPPPNGEALGSPRVKPTAQPRMSTAPRLPTGERKSSADWPAEQDGERGARKGSRSERFPRPGNLANAFPRMSRFRAPSAFPPHAPRGGLWCWQIGDLACRPRPRLHPLRPGRCGVPVPEVSLVRSRLDYRENGTTEHARTGETRKKSSVDRDLNHEFRTGEVVCANPQLSERESRLHHVATEETIFFSGGTKPAGHCTPQQDENASTAHNQRQRRFVSVHP